ncbi:hypothetical protein PPYR_09600 [Photinus pyralis]|uniref:Multidrug resistance-associated protein lethal(2)03659 n=2 Tax=Photinus pyralis TaxID=7054 RepID=A0A5N4AMR4_PHOPY|nr:probable multidrug resistance-associated protein lethal(2)03659 [Photinus pyralis]KAB0798607.1 hypothetical protein PPYR_09600 [Photinus pyralis]
MDCSEQKRRKPNPRTKAGIINIFLFKYVFNIIYTGSRRDLKMEDIYDVLPNFQATRLYHRMNREWQKEFMNSKNPSVFKIFLRIFGLEFALWGIGIFIFEICIADLAQTIVMGKLMAYFEPGSNVTVKEASLYAAGLIGAVATHQLYNNTCILVVWLIGLKMQIACSTMVYRKCLRINLENENIHGMAVTIITKDIAQLLTVPDCGHMLVLWFPKFVIILCIMYTYIGVSAFAGAVIVLAAVPMNALLGKLILNYRLKTAAQTDQRVKLMQEMLTAMRTIKMHRWEKFFSKLIDERRTKEMQLLKILFYIKAMIFSICQLSYRFAFYICVITYVALGNHISAENAFVINGCFGAFQSLLTDYLPNVVLQMAEYKASLHRITKFLMLPEVPSHSSEDSLADGVISVKNATVSTAGGVILLDGLSLNICRGLTVVTGPTGSGKSTLLKLLLRDVPITSGEIMLPGEVSYASQEPWIFPSTIRQNIIFGEPFNEKRYQQVLDVCALKRDLKVFPNGDQSFVSDRGSNLSRGQKVRINLARAIYKRAAIYLLDDCLSSMDGRVGKHIFNECIKGFLKNCVCVLLTNNSLPLEDNDKVLVLHGGRVEFHDSFNYFKRWKNEETIELGDNQNEPYREIDEAQPLILNEAVPPNIYQEYNKIGKVKSSVYYAYYLCGGGWKIFLIVAICSITANAAASWTDYFISFWVDMEQELSGFRTNQTTYSAEYKDLENRYDVIMATYSFVMLGAATCTILEALSFFLFTSKASIKIHKTVIDKVVNAPMIFFDNNLSGNILNRLSRDLSIMDDQMPSVLLDSMKVLLSMYGVLIIVTTVNWYFIVPSIILTVILYTVRRIYMRLGRSLKRLEGAARSPLIGHLNATLEGLTTIRASNSQERLIEEFDKYQDLYSSTLYMNLSTSRAFGFSLDAICNVYITIIVFSFLVSKTDRLAGLVGLAISQSFSLIRLLTSAARQWAHLETQMTSTERVLEYRDIVVEVPTGAKPDNWPNIGTIKYEGVTLQYSSGGEAALENINFYIGPKEKVGIVGRTGAGKTSIISTLFRMYDYEGNIFIDGIDIKSVPIKYLRSKVSIIPQDPVLFSGTIRTNLDPYCEFLDKVLWDALEEVGMKSAFTSLDAEVLSGGMGLSVGEKQLFCLARAIVHNNTILVLDEATANIDPETDTLIQRTIKRKFSNCTVLTLAHKLRTVIDSDSIIVMDAGAICQFGSPKNLLDDEQGLFYHMVQQDGLVRS